MSLSIDGFGDFKGTALYDVSEPAADYKPQAALVLTGRSTDQVDAVTLTLNQSQIGEISDHYVFADDTKDNPLYLQYKGDDYIAERGEVRLVTDEEGGRLEGTFELTAVGLERSEMQAKLIGRFAISGVVLGCSRLVEGSANGSTAGQAVDGDGLLWQPDVNLDSAFCTQVKEQLSALGF
ncbi:MAG: hypothetical protein KC620_01965 [Myxococcales bacterium]|nr:hypothetical protein [Myxococcales bacterium]